jgi:hypothetical protein
MQKGILTILILSLLISSFGCASLRDKFIRQSERSKKDDQIFQSTTDIYPPDVRYNNHWIYYEIWSYEVVESIGDNHKKTYNSAQRALYNLKEMQLLLKEPKAGDLNPYIEEMASITKSLKSSAISGALENRVKEDLRDQVREVKRYFNPDLMVQQNYIKKDVK